ncbi:uncharacterized protein DUF4136 [Marinoscillum furvescens DSM 4134]|uniref:Uncharacterized protein DUF4136 n=2 Tax=Marinoscillum furvescens TaxID=1026 RepID=A0A3D9L0H7_MARFU|nr:uncharacterized protein DUF4136 [Marinoscillum furvescens DSM 4134]
MMVGALLLALSACTMSPYQVITDYDKDATFDHYQTYYWSDEFQNNQNESADPLFYNSLTKKRLKKAIQKELEGRGYVLDANDPDLLVDARVIVEQTNERSTIYQPYYYGYYPYSMPVNNAERKAGSVVIDLIDKERRQLIWQGYAPEVVEMDTKDKQAEIRSAVAMIFAEYEHRGDS